MLAGSNPEGKPRSRDPARTKAQILEAALAEFSKHGYEGATVKSIAAGAACNPRLIYHYYGSKEDLYRAALREIYAEIRAREGDLSLEALPPEDAIVRLTEFTFDFFDTHPRFVSITLNENLMQGQFLRKLPEIHDLSKPLISKMADLLERGVQMGVFRAGTDPLQLYVSIVSLSAHHINAAHTLSATFGTDMTANDWRAARRSHVVAFVLFALTRPESHG